MLVTTLLLLLGLLAISVPGAAVMGVLGLALNDMYAFMPLQRAMGEISWNASSEYILIAIPLFVMLGEILLRAGIAERVYNAAAQWLSWLPGGSCTPTSALSHVRDVGIECRHCCDHQHRRHPADQERGYDERLFRRHCRRRHAWNPHPALDQFHPVDC